MSLYQIQEPEDKASNKALFLSDEIAIGIDLGTTNSLVSYYDKNGIITASDDEGSDIIPSRIDFSQNIPEIGKKKYNIENTLTSVKRFMGKDINDLEINNRYAFKNDNGVFKLSIANNDISPTEASSLILKHLKGIASKHSNKKITKAVITVPAYFDDAARQATKDAAKIAGLEVLRLINEPTAAAVAYGLDNSKEGIYAVYDLGGGTFDVTIMTMKMGVFHVLSTGGNAQLGGDDFDNALLEFIFHNNACEELKNSTQFRECLDKAREIKEHLTSNTSYNGSFPYCENDITITKSDFETAIEELIKQTLQHFKAALKDAEVQKDEIEEVILVGGSTRIPMIKEKLESFIGKRPLDSIDPDKIVAIGAGIQAHNLTHGGDNLLLDVNPLSLGIEVSDGLIDKIIYRNSTIPCEHSQKFATQADNQTGFVIHILQGESEKVKDCRSLAKFELKGIPPLPAGEAKLEVKFIIDADGILSVNAVDLTTGHEQHIEVKPSYGMDKDEILKLIKKAL